MDANLSKTDLRTTLRNVRKDYVAQNASRLDGEYARLAQFTEPLSSLHRLTSLNTLLHSERPSAAHTPRPGPLSEAVIASFKPQHSEINPKYLEEALMLLGATVVWPRVEGELLRFFANDDMPAFVKGAYGLMEPGPRATEKIPDIILMPLLGFDEQGHRLGQGGGFYDRALAKLHTHTLAVGLAWDCQEVESVPVEAHDMPLAGVITPSRFHRF